MVRFVEIFQPLMRIMPEVKSPDRKVSFREKLIWTSIALILFLIMSQTPLYGVPRGEYGYDFLFYLRAILASTRGSLMELGIGPIVTAGLIMQLLVGSQIIKIDYADPQDRALFTGSQKVLAVLISLFQSAAYVMSGALGRLETQNAVLVFLQLFSASIIVILLDEMIQKGWGLGSGVSLFIAANVSTAILWGSLSPFPTSKEQGDGLYRGALIAFAQVIIDAAQTGRWIENLQKAFFRPGYLPSMTGLLATIAVFLLVVYVEAVRVELPIVHARYRGFRGKYPIKLLYTSNIPVILVQALYANILFITQLLWNRFPDNFWVTNVLGNFKAEEGGRLIPTGGIIYYLSPPQGLTGVSEDPIRAAIYAIIFILLNGYFSLLWVEVSGMTPRDLARQLIQAQVQIPGYRSSERVIETILNRYIPTLALFGGFLVGILAVFADFLGAIGSGIGVLLTVGIIYQYYQILAQEQLTEMHPALRGLLGLE